MVPIFLKVSPSQLSTGTSFYGLMALDVVSTGTTSYKLQISDSSLFVYSNINVETGAVGSVSSTKVLLATAVINSAPDDTSSASFAPSRLLAGVVQPVSSGNFQQYVFISGDDSVAIGDMRYMISVINLDDLGFDPNTRPYAPVQWPRTQFWQFANRHNPYLGISYAGETEEERIRSAQIQTAAMGYQTAQTGEPMHMYLDTDPTAMKVWPIYAFPYAKSSQTIDVGALRNIINAVDGILRTPAPEQSVFSAGPLDSDQITVPSSLRQYNPYTATTSATSAAATSSSVSTGSSLAPISGKVVVNLNPNSVSSKNFATPAEHTSFEAKQEQVAASNTSMLKATTPTFVASPSQWSGMNTGQITNTVMQRMYQPIYGFSVYNPLNGEAFIIELVNSDQELPDQLPLPRTNATYDPFYVRVVFLDTLTCYNMSFIVPSLVHDRYGNFARLSSNYKNVLSKSNELSLGYMYSLYDATHNFDTLVFTPYNANAAAAPANLPTSETCVYTNIPYSTKQTFIFNPINLFSGIDLTPVVHAFRRNTKLPLHDDAFIGRFGIDPSKINWTNSLLAPQYFVCRRENWRVDCYLMQATHLLGSAVYAAYGGGDIVPFKLEPGVTTTPDKRLPSYMSKLTQIITNRQYDSVKNFSVQNVPYVIGVTTVGSIPQFMNFSINAASQLLDLQLSLNLPLKFPTHCYVIGQSTTSLSSVVATGASTLPPILLSDTGSFISRESNGQILSPSYQVIPYNNLVYLIRAVTNAEGLELVGNSNTSSGFLIDTYVATTEGNLALARGARYKRSGLSFFGSSYTPATMVDSLDTLDFTSITGDTFYTPTIFIPVPELDASKGFVVDLSNFLSQQVWTFIYSEVVVPTGGTANGVTYQDGYNIDMDGKPVLSLQKLHFIYDSMVTMFTPNDLAHKYPLQPKEKILALTNSQILEGICWRSANTQAQRLPPTNICAQQILAVGDGMDRSNIIYSPNNTPVITPINPTYMGMSVHSILSLSGVSYNIEESAMSTQHNDPTGTKMVSAVSSTSSLLIGVLFDYDNNDLGTLSSPDSTTTKGVVFLNGCLGPTGYEFSSPDHFDVDDILPSQLPRLEQIANAMGGDWDVSFYNTDVSLPRQFWTMTYDAFTSQGASNFVTNVPPPPVDANFSNRTRSLILSMQDDIRPDTIGIIDTSNSIVSASLHLSNGVTGSIFLNKKADRDIVTMGSTGSSAGIFGSLTKGYDFFVFSKDHYGTLTNASFDLLDNGYAMCLVDDGTGTGNKVARYFIDSQLNYYELFTYVITTPTAGIVETQSFVLKIALAAPASGGNPATPNNVNPQDLAQQINALSDLVYAAFGPSQPGLPPAILPIQSVAGSAQSAAPLHGAPDFNGYELNAMGADLQPIRISQIYSGSTPYGIAGCTTIRPNDTTLGKVAPFYGSVSHGLDGQNSLDSIVLQSEDRTSYIPRDSSPNTLKSNAGGAGLGSLINSPDLQLLFSWCFQGPAAVTSAAASSPGNIVVPGDDSVIYTYNSLSNTIVDSVYGRLLTPASGLFWVDNTAETSVYGVIILPTFNFNGNTCTFNLSTTMPGSDSPRYSLIMGNKSFLFDSDNAHVTANDTQFTFNPVQGGSYTVSYAPVDLPDGVEYPSPISMTPFTICAGGMVRYIDIFNDSNDPSDSNDSQQLFASGIPLGPVGRLYTYDRVRANIIVSVDGVSTASPLHTGLVFMSLTNFGYAITFEDKRYSVNGGPVYRYQASNVVTPASYPLLTAPKLFTIGGNFYCFDQDRSGNYISVTGNGQTYLINPYQFSLNGSVYVIDSNIQPYAVINGGTNISMTADNSQFKLNGVQYSVTLRQSSLNGAIVSGQFNITQGNIVIIENYAYQIDSLNGQIVGNGTSYPLTTSGLRYTITTADNSFTVTTNPNVTTVLISNVVYQINNATVVGDGITYPILKYRTFFDSTTNFIIELDGTVSVAPPLPLDGNFPFTGSTFIDGASKYKVNNAAVFDGTNYYLSSITASGNQFSVSSDLNYTMRDDAVAIEAGDSTTYLVNSGPFNANEILWGSSDVTIHYAGDLAAFDGQNYFAIEDNAFTDSSNRVWTIQGNIAINQGNSYEVFSNLAQLGSSYFQVPGPSTYYINLPVAHTGSASGDIYNVFPMSGNQFTLPLQYTISITGHLVTVIYPFTTNEVPAPSLTADAGRLTGGSLSDPTTGLLYECVVTPQQITFVDSNNATYPFPAPGRINVLVASVQVLTSCPVAVSSLTGTVPIPILNNQFIVGTTTYTVNENVAYDTTATGTYWPMQNGRFIIPRADPLSDINFTINNGGTVTKGFSLGGDDQSSPDGNTVYTVNDVTVVRTNNQSFLQGTPPETLISGPLTYTFQPSSATLPPTASLLLPGVTYSTSTRSFTVTYGSGAVVTYSVRQLNARDDRPAHNGFVVTNSGNQATFLDGVSHVYFTFDRSGDNQVVALFSYENGVFTDGINSIQYYVDETDKLVQTISYLPESTQYTFIPANGNKYLIHYNQVSVVFPVTSGSSVDGGTALVGSNTFSVDIDEVSPADGGADILIDRNSFEINGSLYTITGAPVGSDYSSCFVVGASYLKHWPFITPATFKLLDPDVTYTLTLDSNNLPTSIVAAYAVVPSANLLTVNDAVYALSYSGVTEGSVLGQGQSSPIANSMFALPNNFDSTIATFVFADANIYDAASVVSQFTVYTAPTFSISSMMYSLDTASGIVTDANKVPFPLISNPSLFSIGGSNYVIDTNRTPHTIVGNSSESPLATDVTVVRGMPMFNTTFTLNGLVYKYTEDAEHNIVLITAVRSFAVSQPGLTFRLSSSLLFTITQTVPDDNSFPGTTVPIGTITAAGNLTLNRYSGIPQTGMLDFFTYQGQLYTLTTSNGTYVAAQASYQLYASQPQSSQQQLALFNLRGTSYLLTCGSTTGDVSSTGTNPGTIWAVTATSMLELQYGLVYGFSTQPITVTRSDDGVYQFAVMSASGNRLLYDIKYSFGATTNQVHVDTPTSLPSFAQPFLFGAPFIAYPLTFETGGYNAYSTSVDETTNPQPSFSAAYKTPIMSTDAHVSSLMPAQGDFSLQFWHSIPANAIGLYHPVTYSAQKTSTVDPLVYYIDILFEAGSNPAVSNTYVQVNNVIKQAHNTPPDFSSQWRHFALTYTQPYAIACQGAGYEVKQGTNYNFNTDFSIGITFSLSDVQTNQILLYKGTGSQDPPPELSMSYTLGVSNEAFYFNMVDANQNPHPFKAPFALADLVNVPLELWIIKQTVTPIGASSNADPTSLPLGLGDVQSNLTNGISFNQSTTKDGTSIKNISLPLSSDFDALAKQMKTSTSNGKQFTVTFALRQIQNDGSALPWIPPSPSPQTEPVLDNGGLAVYSTGTSHLLIGSGYDDDGIERPVGSPYGSIGHIRKVYLFGGAIDYNGIQASGGTVDVTSATVPQLQQAGVIGYWNAVYDPNSVVTSPLDPTAVAMPTNPARAILMALQAHESEGMALYLNGSLMWLNPVSTAPNTMQYDPPRVPMLLFNAGLVRLAEISLWQMARQEYQIMSDMFGRLAATNEPYLLLYLSGSFVVKSSPPKPFLPMATYIDNTHIDDAVQGCRRLWTTHHAALTVCDAPPALVSYSITTNTTTGTPAGIINEAYVYVKDKALVLYAGKKIGDLELLWVTQEQTDVQVMGYIEGAPPCPQANLTNRANYNGATALTLNIPTSATLRYESSYNSTKTNALVMTPPLPNGVKFGLQLVTAPVGVGVHQKPIVALDVILNAQDTYEWGKDDGSSTDATNKLDETNRYAVRMQGNLAPYSNDLFMQNLNAAVTMGSTPGAPAAKTAILPNADLGGFTTSNPASDLSRAPKEERSGARMFVPSSYGQAFVTSQTVDVYQQTLSQTGTVFGFVSVPNAQIPRDVNIVPFRMSSKYIRPGCLDGVIGYGYSPARLPTGKSSFATSTGQMQLVLDKNFPDGLAGHDASYMCIVEAYKMKKEIDQETFNILALYNSKAQNSDKADADPSLVPLLDFYNEYVWSSKGGTRETKHTNTTSYSETISTGKHYSNALQLVFNVKLNVAGIKFLDTKLTWLHDMKHAYKYAYTITGQTGFDVTASFDGIETDTQMRYASNNDAHFVMNNNSMFNPHNQSGLNLVIGSDGLMYNVVPSVSGGAGLPVSDNIDDSNAYSQPPPVYAAGNAAGPSGDLQPYDRPGKTSLFRSYVFFRQPSQDNSDTFWKTVVDPVWLDNSNEPAAAALRKANQGSSVPWRVLYRVTYSERFLPPVQNAEISTPQISPVVAVPVTNGVTDFLFTPVSNEARPALNAANDIDANIVLVAPTSTGQSIGTIATAGTRVGKPVLPNNLIPFDIVQNASTLVSWGDRQNTGILSKLIKSIMGLNTIQMTPMAPPGSTMIFDVLDPSAGGILYSKYVDPNGFAIYVSEKGSITVYADVNSNPIQMFDGTQYWSLQADYVSPGDGTIMYYIQPPSTYDQTAFDLVGDYDLFGSPGDQWRYYLVSGSSADMTSSDIITGTLPFFSSDRYTGFSIPPSRIDSNKTKLVQGYVLARNMLPWPNLNTNAETVADVLIYKAMSLLDLFPIGDIEVLKQFMAAQYPKSELVLNAEIATMFAKNVISYFNTAQIALMSK